MRRKPKPLLTQAESTAICTLLMERWAAHMNPGDILTVSADRVDRSIRADLTLSGVDAAQRVVIEAGVVDFRVSGLGVQDQLYLLFDALDGYLADYLEQGRFLRMPLDWAEIEFNGVAIRVRAEKTRPLLGSLADEMLAEASAGEE